MSEISYAYYTDHEQTAPGKFINFDDLKEAAKNPAATEKDHTACIHPSTAPAKKKAAVQEHNQMTGLWVDIDSGDYSCEEVKTKAEAAGLVEGFDAFLIYSTASSWREKKGVLQGGRWRVLLSLSKHVPYKEWLTLQEVVRRAFDGGYEAVRVQQILYLPTNPDGGRYEYFISDGIPFNPDHLTPELKAILDDVIMENEVTEKQAKASAVVRRDVNHADGTIIDMVNNAYQIEAIMADYGCRESGHKWIHPDSTTGKPGIVVFDGQYYYSHHGSDQLSDGHRHDVFDLLCYWHFNGDVSAAVRHYANELDPEGQKKRQQEHGKNQQTVTVADFDELLERTQKKPTENLFTLPPNPPELLALPGYLGEIQTFIYNRMTYPDRAAAGITALATLAGFAQTHITIKSRDGLGFNEFFLLLMATGFGKEDLRKPAETLARLAKSRITAEILAEVGGGNLPGVDAVTFRHAMPASPQGIHQLLEKTRSIFFLADEFAEWLKLTHGEAIKQAALGYLMQAYTRANGTIEPGHAVTKEYTPVNNPRISILATSTAEAMFETMSKEQADSGAYNRQVIFVGDEDLPQKRYDGLIYEPEPHLVDFIAKVTAYPPETKITFAPDGWKAFIEQDQELAEPIKRRDGLLGGRLAEQAIKMAGLFALSDNRLTITAQDIRSAFAIRVGLYHRAATLARHRGHLDGLHHTTKALEQVAQIFEKVEGLHRSQIKNRSRKFEKLTVQEQKLVIDTLIENGIAAPAKEKRAFLVSLIYDERNQ